MPDSDKATDYVEVQFKNTRKGYYLNNTKIPLEKGDIVAVEANPGHDIGTVTLTGKLVLLQMKKNNVRTDQEPKRVYRKAKPTDIEKYEEAKSKEHATMIRSRQIAADLGLNMKIGDVEYQGDGNKAIFYYIADERVDFRQLIKVLAEAFRVRIEMKQIGARQEAGRIGGIGPCGRELCCSSWMTNFVSVATSAARYQDISMNPQKLAGQCAKLKCCINYEVDSYVEAQKKLPSREITLETKDNTYYHFKTDIFKQEITYSTDKSIAANLVTISAQRAFEVINMNKKGNKPLSLEADTKQQAPKRDTQDILEESVTRFDTVKKKKKKRSGGNGNANNQANNNNPQEATPAKGNAPSDKPSTENKNNNNKENGRKNNGGNNNNRANNNRNNNRANNNRDTITATRRRETTISPSKRTREATTRNQRTITEKSPKAITPRNLRPTLRRLKEMAKSDLRPNPLSRLVSQTTTIMEVMPHKRRNNLWMAVLSCLLLILASCENQVVYEQYQAIDNTSWNKEKTYFFTFEVTDASVAYDISFEVRNNNFYPYQNLWLFCSEEMPVGPLRRDTVEFLLADDYGKWYGQGFSLFHSSFSLKKRYKFPMEGQYTFGFRQGMRKDSLPGIQEIGLRLMVASD